MEKRRYERVESSLDARLFYGNIVYTGIVTNLSENGMFVNTKVAFPVDSVFMMVIHLKEDTMKVPVKVRRKVKTAENPGAEVKSGMGVELMDHTEEYAGYVKRFKSSKTASMN